MRTWRDYRLSELVALKVSDPAKLIAMYRHVAGLTVNGQLPHEVSFLRMIEAILEGEAAKRLAEGASDTANAVGKT